jgi:hypothetical protein
MTDMNIVFLLQSIGFTSWNALYCACCLSFAQFIDIDAITILGDAPDMGVD